MAEHTPRTDPFHGARLAVLGASGFIGGWVARALVRRGARVHLGVRDTAPAEALAAAVGGGATAHAVDVTDLRSVERFYDALRPALTLNLAGYGVDRTERDEGRARAINADAVGIIARCQYGVRDSAWSGAELVHVGSALEYGTAAGDLRETTPPSPTTVYGRTKLAGTEAVYAFARGTGLRALTARLFTVYGPGEHEGRLLPSLIAARRGDSILPLTAGTQRRDFGYVEEIAEGLLRLALAKIPPGDVVNLATGRLTSVREFAERAAGVLGIDRGRLGFGQLPARGEDMAHDPVNVDRLRTLTGWAPAMSIEEGVRRTIERLPRPA